MTATRSARCDKDLDSRIGVTRCASAHGLTTRRIEQAVRRAAGDRPIESLSIAIVDDAAMADLHGRFMNDPSPTDVLTFDLRGDGRARHIDGEIVVSTDTALREATRRNLRPKDELLRYVVHGVLHLLGMDDRTADQRRAMRRAEDEVLRQVTGGSSAAPDSGRAASRRCEATRRQRKTCLDDRTRRSGRTSR